MCLFMRPYRAPLVNCNLPGVIKGSYFVFLHQSCPLETHTQSVRAQVSLGSKITRIFPEAAQHGLYYCADRIEDPALDAIRADTMVDMIECDRLLEISDESELVEIYDSPV